MARTTVDIDTPVLKEIKNLGRAEGKSLGRLVSELLSEALGHRITEQEEFTMDWFHQDMGALIEIGDKDELYPAMDNNGP
ncbi:MAG: hypothetical protein VX398_04795 [Acidobacteriota bacterium]|nr:hypothetical protein [Acidobacteriota bacterium]